MNHAARNWLRRTWRGWLQVTITLAGIWLILREIPFSLVAAQFSTLRWGWIAAAALLMVSSLVVRSWRWGALLAGLGAEVGFGRLVTIYFIGNFFNSFLPSGFGGDAVRVVVAARDVPADVAAGTVILDRLTGLLALFALAVLALPFGFGQLPVPWGWLIAAVSAGGLAAGAIVVDGRFLRRLFGRLPAGRGVVGRVVAAVNKVLVAIEACGGAAVRRALLISVLFNVILVGWWYAAGQALGYGIPYAYDLLVVPLMSLALLVPSIGGLGVRELLAPALFAGAGLSADEAVALSLLVFVLLRATSLTGAPLLLLDTRRRTAA